MFTHVMAIGIKSILDYCIVIAKETKYWTYCIPCSLTVSQKMIQSETT